MLEKIAAMLAERFDVNAEDITEKTGLKDDLKIDSLDVVELIMDLEDAFGVTVEDEAAKEMSTVGDIVAYIEAHA